MRNDLTDLYFRWICHFILDHKHGGSSWSKLLCYLFEETFSYSIEMDANRADDGTDLRYRFAYEQGLESTDIFYYLDNRPCSVLEMMVGLAVRVEEHIMSDSDFGDRTSEWFWSMISSLGLDGMDDRHFNGVIVKNTIRRANERLYSPNGKGGYITVNNSDRDMRLVEIWYQMMLYLDSRR